MNKQEHPDQKNTGQTDVGKPKSRLASSPDTLPEVLDRLADKGETPVSERVAENPTAPPQTLAKLAEHEAPEVRAAVSENKNTPVETVNSLAADENPDVRYRVAENPDTPPVVLQALLEDENPYVQERAKDTLHATQSVLSRADSLLLAEQFAEAEVLYRELVYGLETLLGKEHAEVAESLHKLAAVMARQGKGEEAAELERRACMIKTVHEES